MKNFFERQNLNCICIAPFLLINFGKQEIYKLLTTVNIIQCNRGKHHYPCSVHQLTETEKGKLVLAKAYSCALK